jgi:hypothetical protein
MLFSPASSAPVMTSFFSVAVPKPGMFGGAARARGASAGHGNEVRA